MEVLTFVWYISSRKWATYVELTLQVFWYIINCRHCGNDLMIIHEILSFVHFHTCDTQFACYTKTVEDVNTEVATKPPCFEWMWRRLLKMETKQINTCSMEMLLLIDMCYRGIHFAYFYDFLIDFGTVRQFLCGILFIFLGGGGNFNKIIELM